jgi:hypothetical protein
MVIGDKYKIEADTLNVTLYQKGISKTNGNTYWRPIAYFATVENALVHLVDLEVAETGLKDFRAVVEKQKELYQLARGLGNSPEVLQRVRSAEK